MLRPLLPRLGLDGTRRPGGASAASLPDDGVRRGSAEAARAAHRRARERGRGGVATASAVPDVLAPGLRVVFCGINPGRVSDAAHAHFANPRNDFWRLLYAAHFTSRLYEPAEQFELLHDGVGVTNAAYRTTPGSGDLRSADFAGSAERLERLASELSPGWIGFVGKEAYRGAFGERPELGVQARRSARRGCSCCRRPRRRTQRCPGGSGCAGFMELAARASGGRRATACARSCSTRTTTCCSCASRTSSELVVHARRRHRPGRERCRGAYARAVRGGRPARLRARPADLDARALATSTRRNGAASASGTTWSARSTSSRAQVHRRRAGGGGRHRRSVVLG